MNPDGNVVNRDCKSLMGCIARRSQTKNIVLYAPQQSIPFRLYKHLCFLCPVILHHVEKITPQPAHSGKKRVPGFKIHIFVFMEMGAGLPPLSVDLLFGKNITPILLARVHNKKMDITKFRKLCK